LLQREDKRKDDSKDEEETEDDNNQEEYDPMEAEDAEDEDEGILNYGFCGFQKFCCHWICSFKLKNALALYNLKLHY